MVDRLRALLDRPLDPSAVRVIVGLAGAIFLGIAVLFVLACSGPSQPTSPRARAAATSSRSAVPVKGAEGEVTEPRPQDPQDEQGSAEARRADRSLRSHRALQHIPYREGGLTVRLVGARGRRAVLRVSAPTVPAARRGWQQFLRRYEDSGHAYVPVFKVSGGVRP